MLQRIYGTAFFDKKELDAWLKQQEEAKKRDHRKLGKELDLFDVPPRRARRGVLDARRARRSTRCSRTGCAGWTRANGYDEIKTPLLYNKALWETCGHWGKYRENMFLVLDKETGEHDFALKPMNCPSHHLLLRPQASTATATCRCASPRRTCCTATRRRARSAGLTRVRQFAQDDAHIYCTEDQIARRGEALHPAARPGLRARSASPTRRSSRPGRRSGSATTRSGITPRRR